MENIESFTELGNTIQGKDFTIQIYDIIQLLKREYHKLILMDAQMLLRLMNHL